MVKTKEAHIERKEDSVSSAGTRGKSILFQAVARAAVIVESRGWDLLIRTGQRKCPNRKIFVFSVKDHYMIWHKRAPGWESHHFISLFGQFMAKVSTTNRVIKTLAGVRLSHLFSCPSHLTYNIPSEQIHTLFVANPGTSPSSDEDIGGPQEIINTNEWLDFCATWMTRRSKCQWTRDPKPSYRRIKIR